MKNKQEAYSKFKQQTDEKREQLENERSTLTSERSSEVMAKENAKARIERESKEKQKMNESNHLNRMKHLKERRDKLDDQLRLLKNENSKEEEKLRKDFERSENNARDSIKTYDKGTFTLLLHYLILRLFDIFTYDLSFRHGKSK